MKKKRLSVIGTLICVLLVSVLFFAFAACGSEEASPNDKEKELESIEIDSSGAKTTFAYDDEFTYDGLVVTGVYSDGSKESIDVSEVRVTGYDMTRPGTQSIRVIYGGKTGRYQITVSERKLPELDPTPLAEITGENPEAPYRVEAESINLSKTDVQKSDTSAEFFADPPADSSHVTSGKYLTNYGVAGNYFGFTFTSDAEYGPARDVSIALRVANGTAETISLVDSFKMYLNYQTVAESGEVSMEGKSIASSPVTVEGEIDHYEQDDWTTLLFRGEVTIKEGVNTLAFEIFDDVVPNIDYIDIFVGNLASNSLVRIDEAAAEAGTVVKEFEDFDLEKVVVRSDFVAAHGLKDGEIFLEPTPTQPNTSKGTSAAAVVTGTEVTTQLLVEDKATVRISVDCASIGDYRVKDHWQFMLDETALSDVEGINIVAGSAADNTFWEWRSTRIAQLDLEAGQYLFTAKITGAGCNIDCFRFEILSYGDFYKEKVVTDLAITTAPTKTEYLQGEDLDVSGLELTATYDDETTENVTELAKISKTTDLEAGDVITATYGDKVVELPVTVSAVTELEITENTKYTVEAESLDRSGVITRSDFIAQRGLEAGEVMVATSTYVSGGKIVEGFAGSGTDDEPLRRPEDKEKGTVWTLSVKTSGAAQIKVGIRMSTDRPDNPAGTFIDCTFGEEKLTPVPGTDDLPAGTAENPYYNCADVDLGTVTVDDAGTYTLTINVLMRFNFDCLTFEVSGLA